MSVLKSGLALGLGLIISMGPQNMFLIRQGLKKEYAYLSALVCSVCDTILIVLSTTGINQLILKFPLVKNMMLALGVLFLVSFGGKSIYTSIKGFNQGENINIGKTHQKISMTTVLLTAVSFSLINPQAIIDTMIMIGGVVNQYPQKDHFTFVIGVIVASFLWFYSITTVARIFSKYLNNPRIWKVLELISGVIMIGFAFILLLYR